MKVKKKHILWLGAAVLVGALSLSLFNLSASGSGYKVLLIGIDGGSWNIVRHLAAENRLPNLQKLILTGAAGHLESLPWRKKSGSPAEYWSPLVWSSIATGKKPNRHGVEDFKQEVPNTVNFRMGYSDEDEPGPAVLDFPFCNRDKMTLLLRAMAPPGMDHVFVHVYFNESSLGTAELKTTFQDFRFAIPVEKIQWEDNRLTFRCGDTTRIGKHYVGADVEYLRVLDSGGHEILDYYPIRDRQRFLQGWLPQVPRQYCLASSFHLKTRTLWEIASHFKKRIAAVGWWATWPAFKVNGYLVSNQVGLHGERLKLAGKGSHLDSLPDLTYPPELLSMIKPMYRHKEEFIPEFSQRFFEMGKCRCVGSLQERIVLERFWQDKFFSQIAQFILDKLGRFDLFAIYFRGTDTMSHQFIGFAENEEILQSACGEFPECDQDRLHNAVFNYYSFIDAQVGELLKRTDLSKTFVVIVTDHGQGAEGRKGVHKNNGFIIVNGPGVRNHTMRDADVLDITPTVLYMLGLPVAQDMDGRVMMEALDQRLVLEKPVAYIDSYDRLIGGEQRRVIVDKDLERQDTEELKMLGYIN
jgi:hypothetical protein